MESKRYKRIYWVVFVVFILLVSVPYIYAELAVSGGYEFAGFLLNPIDGNSYLAKMKQGYQGSWEFRLPYTAERGEGSYLFVYYLFLGHVARISAISILMTFHIARLIGAVLLGLSIYSFSENFFKSERTRLIAFSLALLGSGLGWIGLAFGVITSDLWVPEAYPFLSAYTNPHFSLGLALQLWLLNIKQEQSFNWKTGIKLAIVAALLAEIAAFAIPVVLVVLLGLLVWRIAAREYYLVEMKRLLWVGIGSAPILLYDLWIIYSDPLLSGWNGQNVTSSPPVWDLFISMSPALLLAVWWLATSWRTIDEKQRLLALWLGLSFVLLYVPFNLQRRFLTGYFVPVAFLATYALDQLLTHSKRSIRNTGSALFSLALPTNLIVLLLGFFGVLTLDSQIVLTSGELAAYEWMDTELQINSLVVASPDTGLYIPAYTSMRVIYGHPFETLQSEAREDELFRFFSVWDDEERALYLQEWGVEYVFLGPRELVLGEFSIQEGWRLIYENDEVLIYALK